MRIVLSGVETNNKGAELMLYAILQELERAYPNSEVFIPKNMVKQGLNYIKTSVKLRYLPQNKIPAFFSKIKVTSILNHLGYYSSYLNDCCPIRNVDYFIDGSGLLFSDKRIKNNTTAIVWGAKLKKYHNRGTKIIFLPQGFGTFNKECTKNAILQLDKYADLIFAREKVSYQMLNDLVENKSKVKLYTDFTALVDSSRPQGYEHLKDKVCLIPNRQMINKGVVDRCKYFEILHEIIDTCMSRGHSVYFLNHEGPLDEQLANDYNKAYNTNIEVVSGLNALEVKGLISTAYLVISSRFHGVASSLNGAVPCLATSWHHKYAELFADYNQSDCVLNLEDKQAMESKISEYLSTDTNSRIRQELKTVKPLIVQQNRDMWKLIWSLK